MKNPLRAIRFHQESQHKNKEYTRKRRGPERAFREITAENFANPGKELDIQIHEINRSSYYLNAKDFLQDTL